MHTTRAASKASVGLAFRPGSRHVIQVDASRESVWTVLTDAANRHRWLGGPSTIVEATWPDASRHLGASIRTTDAGPSSPRVVSWRPVPRIIVHAIRPDGVVTRLEFELHALSRRTLVVLDEVAVHPAPLTHARPAPWRTRHWSRRSLAALRREVEKRVHVAPAVRHQKFARSDAG